VTGSDIETALEHADRAIELYQRARDDRGAARALAIAGRAYVDGRRFSEARERLRAALEVLEADPDADTVTALRWLALSEVMRAGPDALELTQRALVLGQALGVEPSLLAELFTDRAMSLTIGDRGAEGIAHYRYAAHLAEQADDGLALGRAYGNLSDALLTSDPAAAADAARKGIEYNRRVGARLRLAVAIANLGSALFWTGQWDDADAVLTAALGDETLTDNVDLLSIRAILAALRGDADGADEALRTVLPNLPDDPQSIGYLRTAQALAAAAIGRPEQVLEHAQAVLELGESIGVYSEIIAWCWPAAARAAWESGDEQWTARLLGYLDGHPRGHVPPLLRAEHDLAVARIAPATTRGDVDAAFERAITALRRFASPYHLAHALVDHAERLAELGERDAASALSDEARAIATELGARPVLDRVTRLTAGERVQSGQT
jgi:tetratricopeptide (TPR) repeat protein